MGGSTYIRLRILLACFILAILVPIHTYNPETFDRPDLSAESPCKHCVLSWSDDQVVKPTAGSGNPADTRHSDSLSKLYRYLWTVRYQNLGFSPHVSNKVDTVRWMDWLQKYVQIHKKVYGWLESFDVILMYGFFIYCRASKKGQEGVHRLSRQQHVTTNTSSVFSFFTSKFQSQGDKEKSTTDSSDDLSPKYCWIFKYPNILWQKDLSVYPAFTPQSWQRTASYSKLAFRNVSETVSFIQLSDAGFKYTGTDLQVSCDNCNKSLNISDFTSSPSEAKYHENGCSFVQATANYEVQAEYGDQWSLSPDTSPSPLSEATFHQEGCDVTEAQATQGIQVGGHTRGSLAPGTASPSAPSFIEDVGYNDVVYTNNIPGIPREGTRARDDIEDDAPPTVVEPVSHIGGCLDQVNNQSSSPLVQPGNWDNQQQLVTGDSTGSSGYEVWTEPAAGSHATQNQTSNCIPTAQQQTKNPATNSPGQLTNAVAYVAANASLSNLLRSDSNSSSGYSSDSSFEPAVASDQAAAQPGVSGSSCSSDTQAGFVDTVDFQPEVNNSNKEVPEIDNNCPKNPGHYSYFPIGNFKLEYIPSNVRHQDVLSFFSLVAKLTVRVVVSTSNRKRLRSCLPHQETKFRLGSGFAVSEPGPNYHIPNTQHSGKFSSVRKYLPYGRKSGYIYIETNRHLVRDDAEAENTIVEFFYDYPSRNGVIFAKGVSVHHSCVLGDVKSILLCRTSDVTLVNMVRDCRNEIENMARNFPQNIKEGLMRRIFLFSHPHGTAKVFSFGEYVMVKYRLETTSSDGRAVTKLVKINNHTQISQNQEEVRKILLYTTDTCPGSTGGVVVSFKKTGTGATGDIILDLWMHNGVDDKHSLNVSAMRTVTTDDIVNHGRQYIFRPTIQDDMAAEAERAANQVVTSPVFTVSKPPSHPAYVTYRKRWESYPPSFIHVHTREALSDAGFFCAGYADCVRCFQCGLGLKSWRRGDIIHEEHFRNRPDCQFLLLKLRETGIDVSRLQERLPRRTSNQSTEQSQAVSNTQPEIDQNPHRQTEETKVTMLVLEGSPNTQTEEKMSIADMVKDSTCSQPCSHEVVVNCAQYTPSETRVDAEAMRRSTVAILEREQQYLKQIFMCKVCGKNPVKDLFLPCGELVACVDCSKLLTHCPSCNKKILATVTTYFS